MKEAETSQRGGRRQSFREAGGEAATAWDRMLAKASDRSTFRGAFREAARQTELETFLTGERDFARELCYIIAEAYLMPEGAETKIGEEALPAELVKEVFGELRAEHLRLVMEKFERKTEIVTNKRAYLRTALYNTVFEFEAEYINRVSHDTGGGT